MTDQHWTWLQGPEERPDPVRNLSASPANAGTCSNDGCRSYLRPPQLSWETYATQWRAAEPDYATFQSQAEERADGRVQERA